jgi:hypothetical protein
MHSYQRILFLVWMLAVLIGIALSAPQLPRIAVDSHSPAGRTAAR